MWLRPSPATFYDPYLYLTPRAFILPRIQKLHKERVLNKVQVFTVNNVVWGSDCYSYIETMDLSMIDWSDNNEKVGYCKRKLCIIRYGLIMVCKVKILFVKYYNPTKPKVMCVIILKLYLSSWLLLLIMYDRVEIHFSNAGFKAIQRVNNFVPKVRIVLL